MREATYTLQTFIKERVATPEEWDAWERVRSAKPPTSRPVLPKGPDDRIDHEWRPASAEFQQRETLRARFLEGLRAQIDSGRWRASARSGHPVVRHVIEPEDWATASIDFDKDRIAGSHGVKIFEAPAASNFEVLRRFVETVCRAAGPPRRQITKEVVEDLARVLCREHYGATTFSAAWDESDIDPNWRKAGRPPKSIPE